MHLWPGNILPWVGKGNGLGGIATGKDHIKLAIANHIVPPFNKQLILGNLFIVQLSNDYFAEISGLDTIYNLLVSKNSLVGYHIFHSFQYFDFDKV